MAIVGIACYLYMAPVSYAEEKPPAPLPRVLVIGDSISIGYMKPLAELLSDKAEALHNPGNARHSGYGLENLDAWIGDGHWDVIHFNFGLHDLKYVDDKGANAKSTEGAHIQVPLPEYRKNLEAIAKRLEKTGAVLVFATTTPFPDKLTNSVRKSEDVPKYNGAALEIMKKHGVRIDNLHARVAGQLAKMQKPNDVHFTDGGYKALAAQAAHEILLALEQSKATKSPLGTKAAAGASNGGRT